MSHSLIERARTENTPIIDGNQAVFVWEGENAPSVMADFNGWDPSQAEMQPIGEGAWTYSLDLPSDAYIEYALVLGSERVMDPFNPLCISNGMGKFNQYFYMPQAHPSEMTRRKPGIPRGEVFSLDLKPRWYLSSQERKVHFYRPPVSDPCPLVVVWDGQDYLRRAHLPAILDILIAQNRIQPLALAMVENGRRSRAVEYLCSEATLMFLLESVLPAARESLNLLDVEAFPGAYGVLGASAGGLMALYTGLRLPHIFGRVLSQSGAFSMFGHDFVVWDLLRQLNPGTLKIWLAAGCFEWLVDTNRRMAGVLTEKEAEFVYHEYSGGHNYSAWQNDLPGGLEYLFGRKD